MRKAGALFLALVCVIALTSSDYSLAESSEGPSLTEKRAVRALTGKFRRARRDLNAQAAVLAEAMKVSPYAVGEIQELIGFQLTPQLNKYRDQLYIFASKSAEKKFAQVDKAEVAALQEKVNSLRKNPNLSKELIKSQGDPAMERLADLVLVDRLEVLNSNRKLVEARQSLLPLGKLWETSEKYLAKFDKPSEGGRSTVTFEEYLVQEEELAVRLALPMSDATRSVLAQNEKIAKQLDSEEARCVLALNLTRILLGIEPVLIDLKLTATARDHSQDMRKLKFFAHESPVSGKKTPWDRAQRFGTSASAENIAMGYGTGPAANLGWFHSPGHHKNMLAKHKRVGIGRDGRHWTELFGR